MCLPGIHLWRLPILPYEMFAAGEEKNKYIKEPFKNANDSFLWEQRHPTHSPSPRKTVVCGSCSFRALCSWHRLTKIRMSDRQVALTTQAHLYKFDDSTWVLTRIMSTSHTDRPRLLHTHTNYSSVVHVHHPFSLYIFHWVYTKKRKKHNRGVKYHRT